MRTSFKERVRITKNKKFIRRKMGLDHFRIRKSRKNLKAKKKNYGFNYPVKKILNY